MADLVSPYVRLTYGPTGNPDTSFMVERSLSVDGPWGVIASGLPLLAGRAVYIDTTPPIGVTVHYRLTSTPFNFVRLYSALVPPITSVWVKDPLRPWADLEMELCDTTAGHNVACADPSTSFVWAGFGDATAREDTGLFDILNDEVSADVWARRKWLDGSFTFHTRTLEAAEAAYTLFTAGGPLFIQAPTVYGWRDAFVQPRDVSWRYGARDQRLPYRTWTVPFRTVGRPAGPIQGTACSTWCAVAEAFPTFGNMVGLGYTWLDLLQTEVLCPGTPPGEDGFGLGPFGSGPFGDGG